MSSRRIQKAAEAIREVVSMAIITDLRDPRIEGVTVAYVEVSPDMRQAKVHGLRSSAGYLQSKLSDRIDTRYTPRLRFELDMGVKQSLAISQMLDELLPHNEPSAKEDETNDVT
jgi:ribosome-binding factor A